MLVQCTFRPSPWSMYSRCPQVGVPSLQPPPTPKFALLPLWKMKPPPVRKSHGQANAEPLKSVSAAIASAYCKRLRMLFSPWSAFRSSLDRGGRGADQHVGDAADGDAQRGDHDAARGGGLLVDDHGAPGDADPLVRRAADRDQYAVERQVGQAGRARARSARDRRGLSADEIGADAVAGDREGEVRERRSRVDLVGVADGRRLRNLGGERSQQVACGLRRVPRVGRPGERPGVRERKARRPEQTEHGGLDRGGLSADRGLRRAASAQQSAQTAQLRDGGSRRNEQCGPSKENCDDVTHGASFIRSRVLRQRKYAAPVENAVTDASPFALRRSAYGWRRPRRRGWWRCPPRDRGGRIRRGTRWRAACRTPAAGGG